MIPVFVDSGKYFFTAGPTALFSVSCSLARIGVALLYKLRTLTWYQHEAFAATFALLLNSSLFASFNQSILASPSRQIDPHASVSRSRQLSSPSHSPYHLPTRIYLACMASHGVIPPAAVDECSPGCDIPRTSRPTPSNIQHQHQHLPLPLLLSIPSCGAFARKG
jgi:hypothetical protein